MALVLSVSVAGIYLLTAKDKKAFMQAWGRSLLTDPEVMMWAVIFLITMLCLWWDVGIQLWALVSFGVGTAVWLYFRRLKRRKSTGESNPPSPN